MPELASLLSHLAMALALALAALALGRLVAGGALWQTLSLVALAGYASLNYGFANWVVRPAGIPIPVGHALAFSALALALLGSPRAVLDGFEDGVLRIWWALVGLSAVHLAAELPRHGLMAIRDASFVLEGAFLYLGLRWAEDGPAARRFLKGLGAVFLATFLYSLTFPFADSVRDLSPVSGIFRPVPVVGNYASVPFFLVLGGFYALLLAGPVLGSPAAILWAAGVAQLGWSFVFQRRSMYVGVVLALLLATLLGTFRRVVRVAVGVSLGVLLLFVLFSDVGLEGKVGPVKPAFFADHLRSLLGRSGPAVGSVRWRLDLFPGLWRRYTASTERILFGEGFGEPLIDHRGPGGAVVRQPHNTHLTAIMRLGAVGFALWVLLHGRLLALFVSVLRRLPRDGADHAIAFWFLLFYALGLLLTSVQPWLEFSYGAIPFYTVVGFALGFLRRAEAAVTGAAGA